MLGQLQLHATHDQALSCGIGTLRELDNAVLAKQRFPTEGTLNLLLYKMKIAVLLLRIFSATLSCFPVPLQLVAHSSQPACIDAAASLQRRSHNTNTQVC
jgi:hypothetical protein